MFNVGIKVTKEVFFKKVFYRKTHRETSLSGSGLATLLKACSGNSAFFFVNFSKSLTTLILEMPLNDCFRRVRFL